MLLLTGALTSKPYAFTARPWELRSVESIDLLDGLGSNIRIDFKETEILRILPRRNSEINEYWISDKIRFFYDSLKRQRLTTPYEKKKGGLKKLKWSSLFSKLSSVFKVYAYEYGNKSINILAGPGLDTETFFLLRQLSTRLGFHCGLEKSLQLNSDNPTNYRFVSGLSSLENTDFCLFIGTNPRFEASIFNLRLRKIFRRGNVNFACIGGNFSTTFPVSFFGLTSKTLVKLAEGKHLLCKKLAQAKNPSIIYGSKLLERYDGAAIFSLLKSLATSTSFFHEREIFTNHLVHDSNLIGGLELGIPFYPSKMSSNFKLIYCVGVEKFRGLDFLSQTQSTLVLQHSHGSAVTPFADFVLPSGAFTEKTGIYFNCEGRPQKTQRALVGPNLAREDWKIVRAFFDIFQIYNNHHTKADVLSNLSHFLPAVLRTNHRHFSVKKSVFDFEFSLKTRVFKSYFKLSLEDFYMEHSLCQTSRIMAKASEFLRSSSTNYKFLLYTSLK